MTTIPESRRVIEIRQFGGPDTLQAATEKMPRLEAGKVLVAIGAVGVNFADTMVRRGEYRKDQQLPCVPGLEAAGRVVAVGPGTSMAIGTRVAAFLESGGAYSDYAAISEDLLFPIEVDLPDDVVAASFLQGVTAWYCVHRYGRVAADDAVLVSGASGGLGTWAVQLASASGATVVGLASTADKRAHALRLGCTEAFDPGSPDLTAQLRNITKSGFDVIIDGVGGPLFERLMPALAKNGHYIVAGSATQRPAMLDTRHLLPRGQSITGFVVRNVMDMDANEPQAALTECLHHIAAGRVTVDITTMGMSDAAKAHALLEERHVAGKLVLDPRY